MLIFALICIVAVLGLAFGISSWVKPNSGSVNAPDGTAYSPQVLASAAKSMKELGIKATLASGSVLVLCIGWYFFIYQSATNVAERKQSEVAKKCNDTIMAYVMSQNYAKRLLKAPGTAEFPMITEVSSRAIGDCKFEILAYVDAQNSFGAKMRTGYSATMRLDTETDRWYADDLKVDR